MMSSTLIASSVTPIVLVFHLSASLIVTLYLQRLVFLADIGKKYYHILHLPLWNYNLKLLGLIFQPFTTNVGSDGISLAAVSMMTVLLSPGKSEKKLSV